MPLDLKPGDHVWVRATVRDVFPGEAYVRLEFETTRLKQSLVVRDADVVERPQIERAAA